MVLVSVVVYDNNKNLPTKTFFKYKTPIREQ